MPETPPTLLGHDPDVVERPFVESASLAPREDDRERDACCHALDIDDPPPSALASIDPARLSIFDHSSRHGRSTGSADFRPVTGVHRPLQGASEQVNELFVVVSDSPGDARRIGELACRGVTGELERDSPVGLAAIIAGSGRSVHRTSMAPGRK